MLASQPVCPLASGQQETLFQKQVENLLRHSIQRFLPASLSTHAHTCAPARMWTHTKSGEGNLDKASQTLRGSPSFEICPRTHLEFSRTFPVPPGKLRRIDGMGSHPTPTVSLGELGPIRLCFLPAALLPAGRSLWTSSDLTVHLILPDLLSSAPLPRPLHK